MEENNELNPNQVTFFWLLRVISILSVFIGFFGLILTGSLSGFFIYLIIGVLIYAFSDIYITVLKIEIDTRKKNKD